MSGRSFSTKREQIMEAALQVFSAKGFYLAKMEDIAQEAGVGKGTVYEYFAGKEDLFEKILKEGMLVFDELLEEELAKAETTQDKLRGLIRQSLIVGKRFYPLLRSTIMETGFLDSPFRAWLMEKHYQRLLFIRDLVEEGIEKQELRPVNGLHFAYLFYGGLGALATFLDAEEWPCQQMEQVVNETLDYYLEGISKK